MKIFILSAIVSFLGFIVARDGVLNKAGRKFALVVFKQTRLRHVFAAIVHVVVLGIIIVTLDNTIPILKWGWFSLFSADGNSGNILVAPLLEIGKMAKGTSYNILVLTVINIFCILLMFHFPKMAYEEEKDFRKGNTTLKGIWLPATKFGLWHLTCGISLSAGIALIFSGFLYSFVYRRKYLAEIANKTTLHVATRHALKESTVYHTVFNWFVVTILVLLLNYLLIK